MRLIIDMDEVLCDFLTPAIAYYNAEHFMALTKRDIEDYRISKYPGMLDCIYRDGFFRNLEPLDYAKACISILIAEGHDVIVASDPQACGRIAGEKYGWISEHLPHLKPQNIMLGNRKDILRGDLIFDDNPDYLKSFAGIKVAMDRRYNQDVTVDFRVNNWREFLKLMRRLVYE